MPASDVGRTPALASKEAASAVGRQRVMDRSYGGGRSIGRSELPRPQDFDAATLAARKLSLHIARAHAVVDAIESDYLALVRRTCGVESNSLLTDVLGDGYLNETNALEEGGVVTVGELLAMFTDSGLALPAVPGLGAGKVANTLAGVLRKFFPTAPTPVAADAHDEDEED